MIAVLEQGMNVVCFDQAEVQCLVLLRIRSSENTGGETIQHTSERCVMLDSVVDVKVG